MYLCKKLNISSLETSMVTTFECRFAGGPMVARFYMFTGRLICGFYHAKVHIDDDVSLPKEVF